jgi:hypothetical protein
MNDLVADYDTHDHRSVKGTDFQGYDDLLTSNRRAVVAM